MKKTITSIILLLSLSQINAQTDLNFSGFRLAEDIWFKGIFQESMTDIAGSPYYDSNFQAAKLVGTEEHLPIRYNILHDNLEFIRDEKIMVVPREEIYKSFKFIHNSEQIDLINNTYYIKFYEGKKVNAYSKPKVRFQKSEKAASGYQDDKPAKFINQPTDYFLQINGSLTPVPKKHKDFIQLFPDRKDELQKYLKAHRPKLNDKNDLKKVLQFINI